jgi:hypothetical protein
MISQAINPPLKLKEYDSAAFARGAKSLSKWKRKYRSVTTRKKNRTKIKIWRRVVLYDPG